MKTIATLPALAAICLSLAAATPRANAQAVSAGAVPCSPALEIPAGIVAAARAQFEDGRAPPAISDADRAAYATMVAAQRASDWGDLCRYRAANAALLAQPADPRRVVFMGDSITQYWGLADPEFFAGSVVNRGISGQTTPQMLLRFRADVIALKPAAVHILAGVNDIAGNTGPVTLEMITGNITSMVELAQANDIEVILATVMPAARFNWAPHLAPSDRIEALNAWIRSYVAAEGLVLADYFPAMATSERAMKSELGLDGVHPNKAGYKTIAPITRAAIDAALAR